MDKWYYSWNGEKLGPIPLNELQSLADAGTLEREDLVWTSGMTEWQPAFSVSALSFSDEPPPLPDSQVIRQALTDSWDEAFWTFARSIWKRKPLFFFLGWLVSIGIMIALGSSRADEFYIVLSSIPAFLFFMGLLITGLYAAVRSLNVWQRQVWLRQKWESTQSKGDWVQFAQDGGFFRSDGFAAKYTFDPTQDRIELRPMDETAPIQLKLVLLSEKELAITWNGETQHYQKPCWWRRVFGA